MEIGRIKSSEPTRIGELLIKVGFISQHQLNDALVLSRKTKTPVGRILLMSGNVSTRDLQSVLAAQAMIRAKRLAYKAAIQCIGAARQLAITFEEALERQGWTDPTQPESIGELAELLLAAEVLSEKQLRSASERSKDTGVPIGRTLVLMGLVSPSVMATALDAQVSLRRNTLSQAHAVLGIKIACTRRLSLEQALVMEGIHQAKPESWLRLGELFALAGMLTESDNLWAVETSLEDGRPFGEILKNAGLVSDRELEAALELQRLVCQKELTSEQASEILKGVKEYQMSVKEACKQLRHFGSQVVSLLKMAGIVLPQQIDAAKVHCREQVADLSIYLRDLGIISPHSLKLGRECLRLIREDKVKINQAIALLNYCARSGISIQQGLQELAWDEVVSTPVFTRTKEISADYS
jgi:hypothetical protein